MAEQISQNSDVAFKNNHPSVTAGRKFSGKDLPAYAGVDGHESDYFRCKQCGFINKRSRFSPGSGWGNITTEYTENVVTYEDSDYYYDDTVLNYDGRYIYSDTEMTGCSFCHASEVE